MHWYVHVQKNAIKHKRQNGSQTHGNNVKVMILGHKTWLLVAYSQLIRKHLFSDAISTLEQYACSNESNFPILNVKFLFWRDKQIHNFLMKIIIIWCNGQPYRRIFYLGSGRRQDSFTFVFLNLSAWRVRNGLWFLHSIWTNQLKCLLSGRKSIFFLVFGRIIMLQ